MRTRQILPTGLAASPCHRSVGGVTYGNRTIVQSKVESLTQLIDVRLLMGPGPATCVLRIDLKESLQSRLRQQCTKQSSVKSISTINHSSYGTRPIGRAAANNMAADIYVACQIYAFVAHHLVSWPRLYLAGSHTTAVVPATARLRPRSGRTCRRPLFKPPRWRAAGRTNAWVEQTLAKNQNMR
jgi:hypothetical protein